MSRGRPRPRALVRIDPENPYARIGVTPTASLDEIKKVLDEKRGEAVARARQSGDTKGVEMMRLQELATVIGNPTRREAYDRMHPWNELLTVQLPPAARALETPYRAALVTAALIEDLGPEPLLPSAHSLALWAPTGCSEELLRVVMEHRTDETAADQTPATDPAFPVTMLSLDELKPR